MLKNLFRRVCAVLTLVSLFAVPVSALDLRKVETQFDSVLYQIERYGLFAEDHEMSDEQRAAYNARITDGETLSKVVNEVLSKHDVHSFYMSPEEYAKSFSSLSGDYVGIGITVQQRDGQTVITDVNFGGPAREAGIEPQDVLLSVDGTPVEGKTLDEIGDLLRGSKGTAAKLRLSRAGREVEAEVMRREIYGDHVWSKNLSEGIEYIRVEAFATADDAAHFEAIWDKLDDKRTAAVVLDLRSNGGGLIDAALSMLNLMLEEPVEMVTCRWRKDQGGTQVIKSEGGGLPLNGIYVLVDGQTASAAEMVAGCLKDAGAAELIGEKTYGKSQGQFHLPLYSGDSLIITTLEMSIPKTGVWEAKGIEPNIRTENLVTLGEYMEGRPALSTIRPILFGETSKAVQELTERLRLIGLLPQATDTFTAPVLKALHTFQRAAGLEETLNADVQTLKLLNQTMENASGYYVDSALNQALALAQSAAAKPLRYAPNADGTWVPAA